MAKNFWNISKNDSLFPLADSKKAGKKTCPKTLKNKLRKTFWGPNNYRGECFSCGQEIDYNDGAYCGRIKAGAYGGEYTEENTRLVCRDCNLGMKKRNMKVYMKQNNPERYNEYYSKDESKTISQKRKKRVKRSNSFLGIKNPEKFWERL